MIAVLRHSSARQKIPIPNLAFIRHYSNKNENDPTAVATHVLQSNNSSQEGPCKEAVDEFPEEPTTCCMSGCANCVWLDYAEKLSAYYKDGGDRAIKEINERVEDANIRAFLLLELRCAKKGT